MRRLHHYEMLSTIFIMLSFLFFIMFLVFILSYGNSLILPRRTFFTWGEFFCLNPHPGIAGSVGVPHCFWLSDSEPS